MCYLNTVRSRRSLLLPTVLLAIGVALLIGCFSVPATRQLQPDWKRRPEHLVGDDPDKPVRIGQTDFADAFAEISPQIGKQYRSDGWGGSVTTSILPAWSILNWTASTDRRQFAVAYQIRTATDVYPLCFMATPKTETRWLTLDVNEQMIVTGATITSEPVPGVGQVQLDEWLQIFDEPQRRKLQAEGLFPADDVLAEAGRLAREHQRRINQQRSRQRPGATSPAEEFWK